MKPNKSLRRLLYLHRQGLTLPKVVILDVLSKRDLYLKQIRDLMDTSSAATIDKMVGRMTEMGLVEKTEEVSANELGYGAPLSALVKLTEDGRRILREADAQ